MKTITYNKVVKIDLDEYIQDLINKWNGSCYNKFDIKQIRSDVYNNIVLLDLDRLKIIKKYVNYLMDNDLITSGKHKLYNYIQKITCKRLNKLYFKYYY